MNPRFKECSCKPLGYKKDRVVNIDTLKAKMFDELMDYAVDDNCDPNQLRYMVMCFGNVIDVVDRTGAMD